MLKIDLALGITNNFEFLTLDNRAAISNTDLTIYVYSGCRGSGLTYQVPILPPGKAYGGFTMTDAVINRGFLAILHIWCL